ncbi:MAG: NADP-dependent oxidoreductase [Betaproteobacteria bacterium]|nr:NADP-dependent oxidoreductase [Betaproteobacteria bacterium]
MKVIELRALGSSEHFHEAEKPLPEMRPGEVRIRIRAASFNPVDHQIRRGQSGAKLPVPLILGRDLSGVIDAMHADVGDFRVGDEVYAYVAKLASSGTYAESVCVPAELVAKKPASLSHAGAAAVPVAAITASLALRKVQATPGTSLFIAGGAGGVGTFAIGLARLLGSRSLLTTAGNATSRDYLVTCCGLIDAQIVDYRSSGWVEQALARNGGGFDAVIDLVGGAMLPACCRLLARDGNLASVIDAPDQDDFELLFENNASFHAVGAHAYSLSAERGDWLRYRELLDQLARQFDGKALRPPPITIVGPLSVETVREAHARMEANAVQGKLVMTC